MKNKKQKKLPEESSFSDGYDLSLRHLEEIEDNKREWFANPFLEGTDAYRGYEEGWYDFTQK
jgi:hypothetical protein